MIDAGLLGGLIGIGSMVFIVIGGCCYENRNRFMEWWKKRRALHQPLLPIVKDNPVLVRSGSGSKQWKINELVASK